MKKSLFIITIVFVIASCERKPKLKSPICYKFSLDCELQKDFLLVQLLTFDLSLVDAYHYPLEKERWYLVENSSHSVPTEKSLFLPVRYMRDHYESTPTNYVDDRFRKGLAQFDTINNSNIKIRICLSGIFTAYGLSGVLPPSLEFAK
jgi:hypothetical protein